MHPKLSLFPEQASTLAAQVDLLYFFLIGISLFFGVLIATLLVVFAIRFRRRPGAGIPPVIHGSTPLEIAWSVIPFGLSMIIFLWGAALFFEMARPPDNAHEVFVVGKQWMWKLQHLEGRREINELHVPLGQAVKLTMTSEDVIHSFFVPAFRVKKDAVPGRYQVEWFEATRPGRYHLFCAEYCGTKHSAMIGSVVVMEPAAFQAWLGGGAAGLSLAAAGQKLFGDLACATCHRADASGRGPILDGLAGKTVKLANGESLTADEAYIRESIVTPSAKVVEGYQPVMPTYQGLVSEEGLMQLVAYIQTLKAPEGQDAPLPAEPKGAPDKNKAQGGRKK